MPLTEKISSFFQNLGISLESLEVQENGEDLDISVKTPDSSLLIGMHGKNLEAFTHILGRIAEKQDGKYYHVHLEVNDYMKAKDERFFSFLESKISFAMSSGKSVRIPNLSSFERKKAHHYISEKAIEGLATKSEGEGSERALVLSYSGTPIGNTIHKAPSVSRENELAMLSEDGVGI